MGEALVASGKIMAQRVIGRPPTRRYAISAIVIVTWLGTTTSNVHGLLSGPTELIRTTGPCVVNATAEPFGSIELATANRELNTL